MGRFGRGTSLEASNATTIEVSDIDRRENERVRREGAMRRAAMTISVLVVALLPIVAAVSPEAASAPEVPVAITQPVGNIAKVIGQSTNPVLPESGMILLVGSALLGLGTIVRRSTRV
jgi:hypothetical protein